MKDSTNTDVPEHYQVAGINTMELIALSLTYDEYVGFLKGNILKYQMRLGRKGTSEDIIKDKDKITHYEKLLEELEE